MSEYILRLQPERVLCMEDDLFLSMHSLFMIIIIFISTLNNGHHWFGVYILYVCCQSKSVPTLSPKILNLDRRDSPAALLKHCHGNSHMQRRLRRHALQLDSMLKI